MDWDVAFDGKSKGNRHLFRITRIALMLAKKEGGSKDIIEAAAWLHNIGLVRGDRNHDANGKRIARKFLLKLKVEHEDMNRVLHCIEAHEGNVAALSKEAKIVHDADVIDKMGPLGIIRQTWKLANSGFTTEEICKMLPPYLSRRRKKLYTEVARDAARRLDKKLVPFFRTLTSQV